MPKPLSAERVRQLLDYNPETGVFTWLQARGLNLAGKVAGCMTPRGGQSRDKFYFKIGVDRGRYYSHVLAWLWMTGEMPPDEIDHKNDDGLDNRWSNLRIATHAGNGRHREEANKQNKSGYLGVHWHPGAKKWRACIMVNRKSIHVGFFDTPELAAEARDKSAQILHGEFAARRQSGAQC